MNIDERMVITQAFFDNVCTPILRKKGAASGTGSDANKSFRDAAAPEYNHDHYRAWWGGFYKQVDRLKRWVFSREETAEPLDQMLADVVNYALIGVSMMVEDGILQFEGNPYGHESPEEETERQGLETWWDSGGAAWRMQTFRAMRRGDDTLKVYSESQILPAFDDLDVVIKEALDKYYTELLSRPASEAFGFAYRETPLVSPPPGKIEGSLSMSKDSVEVTGCFRPCPVLDVCQRDTESPGVRVTEVSLADYGIDTVKHFQGVSGNLPVEISKFVNLYLSCCEQKSPDSVADCGKCLPCHARAMAHRAVKEKSGDKADSGGEEGSSKCSGSCAD